jgi:hypothetical protein
MEQLASGFLNCYFDKSVLEKIEISCHDPKLVLQLALVIVDCIGLCVGVTLYNALLCISNAV